MLDTIDRQLVRLLQGNLPFSENPYETLGRELGLTEEQVVERLKKLQASGKLKRIQAVLKHRSSGYRHNILVVFQVRAELTEELGNELTKSSLVSHCYERQSYKQWPYNLYAMMHSRQANEIENYVQYLVGKYQIDQFQMLYSQEELKKTSMVYFQ